MVIAGVVFQRLEQRACSLSGGNVWSSSSSPSNLHHHHHLMGSCNSGSSQTSRTSLFERCYLCKKLSRENPPNITGVHNSHRGSYTSISFHVELNMIVVTVLLSIFNIMEFHLVQNWKENCKSKVNAAIFGAIFPVAFPAIFSFSPFNYVIMIITLIMVIIVITIITW